jgi:hypothetical protein
MYYTYRQVIQDIDNFNFTWNIPIPELSKGEDSITLKQCLEAYSEKSTTELNCSECAHNRCEKFDYVASAPNILVIIIYIL